MDYRNPARGSKQAYLALVAVLVATAILYATLPLETFAFFAPPALIGALVALVVGIILGGQARDRSRMERGDGVVARWTLDAAQWREFVELNEGTITVPAPNSRQAGVEVVFAENAVYVDGEYYTMDRQWGTHAAMNPSRSGTVYIELSQGGLETYSPIRIPYPDRSHGSATRVVAYFNDPKGRE
jgi:hypothetical protein